MADVAAKRPFPLHRGVARVVAIRDVTPSMRRVTLRDPAFGPSLGVEHPGEVITLGWPDGGGGLRLPGRGWLRLLPWLVTSTVTSQHWRNFTVRAHDPGAMTINVDLFLHGDVGRVSRWASEAKLGDAIGFAGPRVDWQLAPDADWVVLVADETGLPALLAIVETLPSGLPVTAIVEVSDSEEEQRVETAADVTWRWLHRGDAAPGTSTHLADAVAALTLPAGPGQVWGGAESAVGKAVRAELAARDPAPAVKMLGYWKRKG